MSTPTEDRVRRQVVAGAAVFVFDVAAIWIVCWLGLSDDAPAWRGIAAILTAPVLILATGAACAAILEG